jgi:hypothetical protein
MKPATVNESVKVLVTKPHVTLTELAYVTKNMILLTRLLPPGVKGSARLKKRQRMSMHVKNCDYTQ